MDYCGRDDIGFQKETYFFFYGTLMDRSVLAKVLKKPERVELQPARLVGWSCKMWGEYPALLAESTGNIAYGVPCEVQTTTDRERLMEYETNAYRLQECRIELGNRPSSVMVQTFVWDGDLETLREGSFDLKDWVLKQKEFI